MAEYITTDTEITSIADAIRAKAGTSASLSYPGGFVDAISGISGGVEFDPGWIVSYYSIWSNFMIKTILNSTFSYTFNSMYSCTISLPQEDFASYLGDYSITRRLNCNIFVSDVKFYTFANPSTGALSNVSPAFTTLKRYNQTVYNSTSKNISYFTYYITPVTVSNLKDEFFARATIYVPYIYSYTPYSFKLMTWSYNANTDTATFYGSSEFRGVQSIYGSSIMAYPVWWSVSNIELSSVMENITAYGFFNNALYNISAPNITTIGTEAFGHCQNLESAYFPNCTLISGNAFTNCTNLSTASFPTCSYISTTAFYNCTSLASIYLMSSSMTKIINQNVFSMTPISDSSYLGAFGSVYVPSSMLDVYKADTQWSFYTDRLVGI